jgi:hypothetical protein
MTLNVGTMKTQTIYLTTSILLATSPLVFGDAAALSTSSQASEQGLKMRYVKPAGNIRLSVTQDISAGEHDNIADRAFSLEFSLNKTENEISVNINKAKASYTAHDMTQRLPATEVVGKTFTLTTSDDGLIMNRTNPGQGPQIGVGQIIGGDYPVGLALIDILPALPIEPVNVGSRWSTIQNTRSLEGWAWAAGDLSSQHSVTAIDSLDGHQIVSVESIAQAQLKKAGDGLEYSGDGALERTTQWRFDTTDGRLLSLSMQQNTSGVNSMPQGEVNIRQITEVEYTVAD